MKTLLASALALSLAATAVFAQTRVDEAKMEQIRNSAINAGINVEMFDDSEVVQNMTDEQANTVLAILSNSNLNPGQMEGQIKEILGVD